VIAINKTELKGRLKKMAEFTQDELTFISHVLSQVTWKAGQSQGVILSETIINKCNEGIESKPDQEKGE